MNGSKSLSPFGRWVRHYRIDHDMTAREMARLAGISTSYLTSVEWGKKPPSDRMVDALITGLALSPSDSLACAAAAEESRHPPRGWVRCDTRLPMSGQLVVIGWLESFGGLAAKTSRHLGEGAWSDPPISGAVPKWWMSLPPLDIENDLTAGERKSAN